MSPKLEGQEQAVPYPRARRHGISSSGARSLRYLLLATQCGDKQPLTTRTMCSSAVKVTPDRPHRT